MSKISGETRSAVKTQFRIPLKLLYGLALLAMLFAVGSARAGEPDEDYIPIYTQIQDADSLEASGQIAQALTKYRAALASLQAFQKIHPTWNAKVVSTRLNRVVEKITVLSEKAAAPPARTNAAAGATAGASGTVKLLDAGAEPRKVLRLHPKAGDKQAMEMTLKIGMETKMGQVETPAMKLPAIKLSLEVTVKSVSPEGDIDYEMVMSEATVADEPGVMPQMAEILKASFAKVKGTSGAGTVSDRGISKATAFKIASGADQQSRQMMDQMKGMFAGAMLRLPEAPVGPGAKWELRRSDKSQGFPVDLTETYQLVTLEGDGLTLKTTLAESAANQKIQSPTGAASKVELTKLVGDSTGELTYDLGGFMPSEASSDHHMTTTMSLGGSQKQTIKMDIGMRLQAK